MSILCLLQYDHKADNLWMNSHKKGPQSAKREGSDQPMYPRGLISAWLLTVDSFSLSKFLPMEHQKPWWNCIRCAGWSGCLLFTKALFLILVNNQGIGREWRRQSTNMFSIIKRTTPSPTPYTHHHHQMLSQQSVEWFVFCNSKKFPPKHANVYFYWKNFPSNAVTTKSKCVFCI